MALHLIHILAYLHLIQCLLSLGLINSQITQQFVSPFYDSTDTTAGTISPSLPQLPMSSPPTSPPQGDDIFRRHALLSWPERLLPSEWINDDNTTTFQQLIWSHWTRPHRYVDTFWWYLFMHIYRPWFTYTIVSFYVYSPSLPFIGGFGWGNLAAEKICTKLATDQATSEFFWLATTLTKDRCHLIIHRQLETSLISLLSLSGIIFSFMIAYFMMKLIWTNIGSCFLWPLQYLLRWFVTATSVVKSSIFNQERQSPSTSGNT
jgi:hypothetical protein